MSILDIFKSQPVTPVQPTPVVQQQTPAVVPTQPGAIPAKTTPDTVTTPVTDANGVIPVVDPNAVPAEPESPLAPFEKLWETVPVDPNNPAPVKEQASLSAEELQKAVANATFTSGITPEVLTAVAAGGEEAQAAFVTALNDVARQVMVQSTLVGNKLTDQAVAKAVSNYKDTLPELLRSHGAADHLHTSNPLFQNPAIKPVIEATQAALLQKFPNATHAELTKMTQDYIVAMGESFAPAVPGVDVLPGEQDWTNFLK